MEVLGICGVSREQTRTDHLRQVAKCLGWRPAKSLEPKELDEFLPARAMEHDSPSLLLPTTTSPPTHSCPAPSTRTCNATPAAGAAAVSPPN
ncbi:DUF4158 domain-containing protein [Streptomyces griseochromogenes]|uniref:DUF4158 domain-containing protein n=1 Tax=Streptomyces griseochromogenes TaxID=68214 RepID=UPI00355923ED